MFWVHWARWLVRWAKTIFLVSECRSPVWAGKWYWAMGGIMVKWTYSTGSEVSWDGFGDIGSEMGVECSWAVLGVGLLSWWAAVVIMSKQGSSTTISDDFEFEKNKEQ